MFIHVDGESTAGPDATRLNGGVDVRGFWRFLGPALILRALPKQISPTIGAGSGGPLGSYWRLRLSNWGSVSSMRCSVDLTCEGVRWPSHGPSPGLSAWPGIALTSVAVHLRCGVRIGRLWVLGHASVGPHARSSTVIRTQMSSITRHLPPSHTSVARGSPIRSGIPHPSRGCVVHPSAQPSLGLRVVHPLGHPPVVHPLGLRRWFPCELGWARSLVDARPSSPAGVRMPARARPHAEGRPSVREHVVPHPSSHGGYGLGFLVSSVAPAHSHPARGELAHTVCQSANVQQACGGRSTASSRPMRSGPIQKRGIVCQCRASTVP